MSTVSEILADVRSQLAPSKTTLKEARDRRSRVVAAANSFNGVRDRYNSGSIAHGTANDDLDADCGIVLDRRTHSDLGPEGSGEGPNETVKEVRDHVAKALAEDEDVTEVRRTKRRAIQVSFDEDPSVDLVVALERKGEPGVWIPNRPEDEWDPAHPAEHTRLLLAGGAALVRVRARAIRLAKGWDAQAKERALSSFNIEALALECVDAAMSEGEALSSIFSHGAKEIEASGETDDPAGVSGPIRLLLEREVVVQRLQKASQLMQRALDHEDDEQVARAALVELFPDYVTPSTSSSSKETIADAMRRRETFSIVGGSLAAGTGTGNTVLGKRMRAYGDAREQ